MMIAPIIRPAHREDVPFLVDSIVSAEKSNSPRLGLATLFGLSEEETREFVDRMLLEEVDGCEFSISSFLVAEMEGRVAAAVGGWVEGFPDDIPSSLLKSNLIGFTFPAPVVACLRDKAPIIGGIRIEREPGTLQIEYVHTAREHRGLGLAGMLIHEHVNKAASCKAQVQVFANNTAAISLYTKAGFVIKQHYRSAHPDILEYMPHDEKLLMERPPHEE